MRTGWSDKQAAVVLEIQTSKVSQSLTPALTKIAKLYRADPVLTMRSIQSAVDALDPVTPPTHSPPKTT